MRLSSLRTTYLLTSYRYPDKEALNSIYTALLGPVFGKQCKGSATWDVPGAARKLAMCTVRPIAARAID